MRISGPLLAALAAASASASNPTASASASASASAPSSASASVAFAPHPPPPPPNARAAVGRVGPARSAAEKLVGGGGPSSSDDERYRDRRLPPVPPPRPPPPPSFLDAIWGIATSGSPWEYMIRMRAVDGHDGVVPVDLGPAGRYNFLLSPESVRSATVEESSSLPRRFSVPLFESLGLDRGIVYEQGERHRRHKRLCIPSFEQSRSMGSYVAATREELDALSGRFRSRGGDGRTLDLYSEMRRSTLNVVLAVTFGLGSAAVGGDDPTFRRADELSRTIGEYLERVVALANEIPPLWKVSPILSPNYSSVTDRLLPRLRELVAEVISARREADANGGGCGENGSDASPERERDRADLLSVLVDRPDLTDSDIRSILFDVVIAGSDTTASTTTASIYVLHEPRNARWLRAARDESDRTDAGGSAPLSEIQRTLPVATAVAREVLRLYPPVPFVGRTATEDATLCDGTYDVREGETYCFSPWFLGRDPTAWGADGGGAGADVFDPQRWLDDPVTGGAPTAYSWLPFGAGPRGCLGTRLGLTEVTLGVSRLLRDFRFEFETRGPLPVKYDLTLNLDGVMSCRIGERRVEDGASGGVEGGAQVEGGQLELQQDKVVHYY